LDKEKEQGRRKRRRKVGVMAREEGKMRGIWEIPRHKEIRSVVIVCLPCFTCY
jgi:hypothetical protein